MVLEVVEMLENLIYPCLLYIISSLTALLMIIRIQVSVLACLMIQYQSSLDVWCPLYNFDQVDELGHYGTPPTQEASHNLLSV